MADVGRFDWTAIRWRSAPMLISEFYWPLNPKREREKKKRWPSERRKKVELKVMVYGRTSAV